jgi:hypothetical protein
MKKYTTISTLNETVWYRILKVFYLFANLSNIYTLIQRSLELYSDPYSQAKYSEGLYDFFFYLLILEITRRSFYYIILGSIKPKK